MRIDFKNKDIIHICDSIESLAAHSIFSGLILRADRDL